MKRIQIAIIEDEPLVSDSIRVYFEHKTTEISVAMTAVSVESFLAELPENFALDILLLDVQLPGISGIEGIPHLRRRLPNTEIVMLTTADDSERIFSALSAGASSYISKTTDLDSIKEALLEIHRGGAYMSPKIARKVIEYFNPPKPEELPPDPLTDRQMQIAKALLDGLSYKMIADQYDISVETVRDHIKKIYKKLEINSRMELADKINKRGKK